MVSNNINLWFAKDKEGKVVLINDVDINEKVSYYCPVCGSVVIPKAIKDDAKMSSHFAHIDKSKCSSEHMIHWWIKNKLLEVGDKFTVSTYENKDFICKEIHIEKEVETSHGIYKSDITIITECGQTIYFEIAYTNKKKISDYLDMWIELNNIVVEVEIKNMVNTKGVVTAPRVFKGLFYEGKGFEDKNFKGYKNTIGKYREYVRNGKNKSNKKLKESVIKLDWLWNEILKYNKGESDIETIVEVINYVDDESYRDIVVNIMRKARCNNLYQDYQSYYKNKISKWWDENLDKYYNGVELEFKPMRLWNERIYKGINVDVMFLKKNIKTFHNENIYYEKISSHCKEVEKVVKEKMEYKASEYKLRKAIKIYNQTTLENYSDIPFETEGIVQLSIVVDDYRKKFTVYDKREECWARRREIEFNGEIKEDINGIVSILEKRFNKGRKVNQDEKKNFIDTYTILKDIDDNERKMFICTNVKCNNFKISFNAPSTSSLTKYTINFKESNIEISFKQQNGHAKRISIASTNNISEIKKELIIIIKAMKYEIWNNEYKLIKKLNIWEDIDIECGLNLLSLYNYDRFEKDEIARVFIKDDKIIYNNIIIGDFSLENIEDFLRKKLLEVGVIENNYFQRMMEFYNALEKRYNNEVYGRFFIYEYRMCRDYLYFDFKYNKKTLDIKLKNKQLFINEEIVMDEEKNSFEEMKLYIEKVISDFVRKEKYGVI